MPRNAKLGYECIMRKGEARDRIIPVSRQVRLRGASWAREGVRGLPQHALSCIARL